MVYSLCENVDVPPAAVKQRHSDIFYRAVEGAKPGTLAWAEFLIEVSDDELPSRDSVWIRS